MKKLLHSLRSLRSNARKHPRAVFAAALAIVLAAGFAWYANASVPPYTFVLREDGWHPETMQVEPGQAVTFVNKSSNPFWPASNSHPQHDQYREFDIGHPAAPGESWTFTFDREGKWGFHDHLRSFYTGTVYVGAAALTDNCIDHIKEIDASKKRECWDEALLETLRDDGAKAAFGKFAEFYASDDDFARIGCHLIAHTIGDYAYGEYLRRGKDLNALEFPPESAYCGYGYYHGILEHMIRDNPDFDAADKFCQTIIAAHEKDVPRIRLNCYHAIGHGFIPEPTDVEKWGNAHDIPAPAIAACGKLTKEDEHTECLQGAFNVISDWMWNNEFGLKFPPDDPLSLCRSFPESDVSRACYYELSMRIIPFVKDDLTQVYKKFVASIDDDAIAGMVINSAAAAVMSAHIMEDTFIPYLYECRALPARVQVDCLKGLSAGFIAHGEPEKEYVKALAFCGDPILTGAEKETCYFNIARTFKGAYSKEKVAQVCASFDPKYQHYCSYDS